VWVFVHNIGVGFQDVLLGKASWKVVVNITPRAGQLESFGLLKGKKGILKGEKGEE